jgi:hypothetical protein
MMTVIGHVLGWARSRFTYENRPHHSPSVNPETDTESRLGHIRHLAVVLPECNRLALTATPASAVAGRPYPRRGLEHSLQVRNLWPIGKKTLTGRLAPVGAGGARVGGVARGARSADAGRARPGPAGGVCLTIRTLRGLLAQVRHSSGRFVRFAHGTCAQSWERLSPHENDPGRLGRRRLTGVSGDGVCAGARRLNRTALRRPGQFRRTTGSPTRRRQINHGRPCGPGGDEPGPVAPHPLSHRAAGPRGRASRACPARQSPRSVR